jgi:hypothetical protein
LLANEINIEFYLLGFHEYLGRHGSWNGQIAVTTHLILSRRMFALIAVTAELSVIAPCT